MGCGVQVSLVEHALELAVRGYHVFPLVPGGKKPKTANGWEDATQDTHTITGWWDRWPDANIGIACGPSGIVVLDGDSKHGCDADRLAGQLNGAVIVRTGKAPERSEKHPNSLPGMLGVHAYFRGSMRTVAKVDGQPGVEVRGNGAYVVAPPSIHPSGVPYAGQLPGVRRLPETPGWMVAYAKSTNGTGAGEAPTVERVPPGGMHEYLADLAVRLARSGVRDVEVADAQLCAAFEAKKVPGAAYAGGRQDTRRLAEWTVQSEIAGREHARNTDENVCHLSLRENVATNVVQGDAGFYLRRWREEDIHAPRWVWPDRIPVGSTTTLVADGGTGKGTLVAWLIARLTKGELPGAFAGKQVNVLVLGTHEDGVGDTWVPRIKAAGGDVTRVASLESGLERDFEIVRDASVLEAFIRAEEFRLTYLDQPLDHLAGDQNSNQAQDVRRALKPLGRLARSLELAVLMTVHPSYRSVGQGLRSGGSAQWRNVVRSELVLGYHPDPVMSSVRVLARGKKNVGLIPPALVYGVEERLVINPATGEAVSEYAVSEMTEDHALRAEDVEFAPPRQREEPKQSIVDRVMLELGSDGEWHSKMDARARCVEQGVGGSTFDHEFSRVDYVVREQRGKEAWWRLS